MMSCVVLHPYETNVAPWRAPTDIHQNCADAQQVGPIHELDIQNQPQKHKAAAPAGHLHSQLQAVARRPHEPEDVAGDTGLTCHGCPITKSCHKQHTTPWMHTHLLGQHQSCLTC